MLGDDTQASNGNNAESDLEKDISRLLESKFFKKDVSGVPDVSLQTDDVQAELAATLGGVYANVEKGVGAEMTEASVEPEGELSTE